MAETERIRQNGIRKVAKNWTPDKYKVIFHNDDVTTFDFVVQILQMFFFKNEEEAMQLTIKIDSEGSAVVGVYVKDVAMSKALRATTAARVEGFPLKVTVEKDI